MPDEYEVKWARARAWRTRAPNNYEARERLRMSSNPLDQKAVAILEANDAAIEAARPESVREAEEKRAAEISTGNGVSASEAPEGGSSAANAAPAVSAPSFAVRLLDQQMNRLRATVQSAGLSDVRP